MRTFVKPLIAAAGASILALGMSAAPALAVPAGPNDPSPSATATNGNSPEQTFTTGATIRILEGEDSVVRPDRVWSCGLLRLDGYVASTPSKDNHYESAWRVAVGASHAVKPLTIVMPNSSSTGLRWVIPDQKPVFGDNDGDVSDLPATNTHPEFHYINDDRVNVENKDDKIVISVPDGLEPGEYFNVEFDSKLKEKPTVGSEFVNELTTNTNCSTASPTPTPSTPDATSTPTAPTTPGAASTPAATPTPNDSSTSVGGETEDEKCEQGMHTGPNGEHCDRMRKHPVKVNSGGENDSTSGLIALGLGAAVVGGAAAYGLRRGKKA